MPADEKCKEIVWSGPTGYHKDANTALGITDAFRDVEMLAGALDSSISGRKQFVMRLGGEERYL